MPGGVIRYAVTWLKCLKVYLEDSRLAIDIDAAKRFIRGIARGRKTFMFYGCDSGGDQAAAADALLVTDKLNAVDPRAYLM